MEERREGGKEGREGGREREMAGRKEGGKRERGREGREGGKEGKGRERVAVHYVIILKSRCNTVL